MTRDLIQGELLPSRFNELLNGPLSTRIAYLRAEICPCSDERDPGSPDPRCPICAGLGYTWADVLPTLTRTVTLTRAPAPGHEDQERLPDPAARIVVITGVDGAVYPAANATVMPDGSVRWSGDAPAQYERYTVTMTIGTLRAGVQGVMASREYQVRGEYDVLDVQMTIDRYLGDGTTLNPAWECGESDRFTLLDGWRRHAQRVQRGATGPSGDLVLYRSMRNLQVSSRVNGARVTWTDADYTFTDGRIVWVPGRGPKLRESYAVQGEANPEYYVFKALPQVRPQNAQPLPRRIVLKGFEAFPNRRPSAPVAPR